MPYLNKPRKSQYKRRPQTTARRAAQAVYNTPLWKQRRMAKLREQPLCEVCLNEGRVKIAEQVHHIVPFSQGATKKDKFFLAFQWSNLQSICRECHKKEHR